MDITLHIIANPATHELEGMKAAMRYRRGDILDVYRANKYATLQSDGNYKLNKSPGHPRFVFIHIKNIPDTLDKQKIKAKLIATVDLLDDTVRRRKWHIPPSILPSAFKQKLLAEKEITVEFATVKAYIRKKLTPIILDPDSDDITTSLTDEDLS